MFAFSALQTGLRQLQHPRINPSTLSNSFGALSSFIITSCTELNHLCHPQHPLSPNPDRTPKQPSSPSSPFKSPHFAIRPASPSYQPGTEASETRACVWETALLAGLVFQFLRASGTSRYLEESLIEPKVTAEARKLEHQSPHALKVKYKGSYSTNPPKAMFQLSGVHCKRSPLWTLIYESLPALSG